MIITCLERRDNCGPQWQLDHNIKMQQINTRHTFSVICPTWLNLKTLFIVYWGEFLEGKFLIQEHEQFQSLVNTLRVCFPLMFLLRLFGIPGFPLWRLRTGNYSFAWGWFASWFNCSQGCLSLHWHSLTILTHRYPTWCVCVWFLCVCVCVCVCKSQTSFCHSVRMFYNL